MEKVTVNCGDWGQSWGLGTNTVGKLSTEDRETFTWRGHCQGRHGNVWNRGSVSVFKFEGGDIIEVTTKGTRPNREALLEGLRDLNDKIQVQEFKAKQRALKQARKGSDDGSTQLSFNLNYKNIKQLK